MPAIWASSERPLFVRTVWVDGMRHAILSPDDPVVNPRLHPRRPRTSTDASYVAKHQSIESRIDRLNSCLVNLHVVVEKNFPDGKVSQRIARRQSAPPCARTACTERSNGLLEIYVNDFDESLDESAGLDETRQDHRSTLENEKTYPTNGTDSVNRDSDNIESYSSRSQRADGRSSADMNWNPLSERVLQWLNLSGRVGTYEAEKQDPEKRSRTSEEDRRRWRSAVRRRRHISQTRESSALATRERIVVQNYKLRKNCKLDCVTKAMSEAKSMRKRSSKKDTIEDQVRREGEIAESKNRVAEEEDEEDLKRESEARDDLVAVWSPPGRLHLRVVMPSFNSKHSSSLESLAD